MQPDNQMESLSTEALLKIRDDTAAKILKVMVLPVEERRAQRNIKRGGGTLESALYLPAHFFAAADRILLARGVPD